MVPFPKPVSPAKRATQDAINTGSAKSLHEITTAAAGPEYADVVDELSSTLAESPFTDDWRKLANALWLIDHLLSCTPQLMNDLCAEPGMLRSLCGYWAEDEVTGQDLGLIVRTRAQNLLYQLEAFEQSQLMEQAVSSAYSMESAPCWEAESPTNSEDSTATCSPFSETGANGRSHKPHAMSFQLPSLKLPKLRLGRSSSGGSSSSNAATAAAAAAAIAAPALPSIKGGRPPLAAAGKNGSFKSALSGSGGSGVPKLSSSGSFAKSLSLRHGSGSQEMVQAWGAIRGQNSVDFARMLQALDDKAFDAAQEAYEQCQRPPHTAAVC